MHDQIISFGWQIQWTVTFYCIDFFYFGLFLLKRFAVLQTSCNQTHFFSKTQVKLQNHYMVQGIIFL